MNYNKHTTLTRTSYLIRWFDALNTHNLRSDRHILRIASSVQISIQKTEEKKKTEENNNKKQTLTIYNNRIADFDEQRTFLKRFSVFVSYGFVKDASMHEKFITNISLEVQALSKRFFTINILLVWYFDFYYKIKIIFYDWKKLVLVNSWKKRNEFAFMESEQMLHTSIMCF